MLWELLEGWYFFLSLSAQSSCDSSHTRRDLEGRGAGQEALKVAPNIELASKDPAQMSKEGDMGQQQLPQHQQRPWEVGRWDSKETKN